MFTPEVFGTCDTDDCDTDSFGTFGTSGTGSACRFFVTTVSACNCRTPIEFLNGLAVPSEYFDFILSGLVGAFLTGEMRMSRAKPLKEITELVEDSESEGDVCG